MSACPLFLVLFERSTYVFHERTILLLFFFFCQWFLPVCPGYRPVINSDPILILFLPCTFISLWAVVKTKKNKKKKKKVVKKGFLNSTKDIDLYVWLLGERTSLALRIKRSLTPPLSFLSFFLLAGMDRKVPTKTGLWQDVLKRVPWWIDAKSSTRGTWTKK